MAGDSTRPPIVPCQKYGFNKALFLGGVRRMG